VLLQMLCGADFMHGGIAMQRRFISVFDFVFLQAQVTCWFFLVARGGVTLLAGHTHQPDESVCGGQHCCH
jgi:hypothetical protein